MEQILDRGGRVLTVREVTSSDVGAIEDLFRGLSTRSNRQRFLSTSTTAGPQYVHALADPLRTLDAMVVLSGSQVVAVGSTHPLPDGTVEFAVTVDDHDQGRGVGTVLVEALVMRSRRRGVRTMVGTVLGANAQMFDVLAHLGLTYHSVVEGGIADVTVSIVDDPRFVSAHEVRTQVAQAAAARALLAPTRVAVLGPPARARIAPGALAGHPEVPVSSIHRGDGGFDVPAGTELALIPEGLSDAAPAALACAEAGVRAIALLRSGRQRTRGLRGRDVLDTNLLQRIRGAGARVLGPGCAALVNTDPLIRLRVGESQPALPAGSVAVVTDDATCLGPLRAELASRGVGISVIVDVARAVDLGVQDVVAWLAHDPRTDVILISLGGSAPDALVHELEGVHRACKPVALLTTGGRHAGPTMKRIDAGPIRATSLGDLADLAMLLVLEGRPPGRRVAVVTSEGVPANARTGRQLPPGALFGPDLTQHTEMRIHSISPGTTADSSGVALSADATPGQVHDIVETLVEDPGVDAVVIDHVGGRARHQRTLWQLVDGLPGEGPRGRPTPVVVAVDRQGPRHHGKVPVFASVNEALEGLARTCSR